MRVIPSCFWNGTDEKDLAESVYVAAISRPLAGAVHLSTQCSHAKRPAEEFDGGITRTEGAAWSPFKNRNTDWVKASARWARANQKPALMQS